MSGLAIVVRSYQNLYSMELDSIKYKNNQDFKFRTQVLKM